LERAFLEQFGEEVDDWFRLAYAFDANGAPVVRLTRNGVQLVLSYDDDGSWYIEDKPLVFDSLDSDEAQDALLVAIDDLVLSTVEQTKQG
jgi:hypothetical protein